MRPSPLRRTLAPAHWGELLLAALMGASMTMILSHLGPRPSTSQAQLYAMPVRVPAAAAHTAGKLACGQPVAAAMGGVKCPPFPELDSDPDYCSRLRSVLPLVPPILTVPTASNYSQESAAAGIGHLKKMLLRSGLQYKGQPYNLFLYNESDIISRDVFAHGMWDAELLDGIHQQLTEFAEEKGLAKKDVYFMDFGGNLGSITLPIAASGFRVFSFEALYSNYIGMKLSICDSPYASERVTLINKAVGNAATWCRLYSPVHNIGNGMVRCGNSPSPSLEKHAIAEVVRLDDLLASVIPQLKGRVGVVKLNIGGFEPLAVEGGDTFFREVAPPYIVAAIVEEYIWDNTGRPAREFLKQMVRRGYQAFTASQQPILVNELETWTCKECTVHFKL